VKDLVSLDHSICPRQHVRRNRQIDLLGGFEIDDQLKLGWLLDGKIRWLGSLEDLIHVGGNAPVAVREVRPVVHEPTGIYISSEYPLRLYIDGNRPFNAKPTIRVWSIRITWPAAGT
jgi:hypothetical protein